MRQAHDGTIAIERRLRVGIVLGACCPPGPAAAHWSMVSWQSLRASSIVRISPRVECSCLNPSVPKRALPARSIWRARGSYRTQLPAVRGCSSGVGLLGRGSEAISATCRRCSDGVVNNRSQTHVHVYAYATSPLELAAWSGCLANSSWYAAASLSSSTTSSSQTSFCNTQPQMELPEASPSIAGGPCRCTV